VNCVLVKGLICSSPRMFLSPRHRGKTRSNVERHRISERNDAANVSRQLEFDSDDISFDVSPLKIELGDSCAEGLRSLQVDDTHSCSRVDDTHSCSRFDVCSVSCPAALLSLTGLLFSR
jgi:hypothetical protein